MRIPENNPQFFNALKAIEKTALELSKDIYKNHLQIQIDVNGKVNSVNVRITEHF